jgi:hypothetical protein
MPGVDFALRLGGGGGAELASASFPGQGTANGQQSTFQSAQGAAAEGGEEARLVTVVAGSGRGRERERERERERDTRGSAVRSAATN